MYPNIYREMAGHGRMTIKELSSRLNIDPKTLANKLNGKTQFNLDEMLKMQQIFGGISLDDLMRTERE